MSNADAAAAVSRLMAAFRQDARDETIAIYAEKLSDMRPDVLAATIDRLIETVKFFPSIFEIRHCAGGLCGLLPGTPAEALALTRRADVRVPLCRRDGSFTGDWECSWEWPEDANSLTKQLAQQTLAAVGEPVGIDGKDYFGWDNGFKETYEAKAEGVIKQVLADLSQACLPSPPRKALPEAGAA